jgi:hypothetical protein
MAQGPPPIVGLHQQEGGIKRTRRPPASALHAHGSMGLHHLTGPGACT